MTEECCCKYFVYVQQLLNVENNVQYLSIKIDIFLVFLGLLSLVLLKIEVEVLRCAEVMAFLIEISLGVDKTAEGFGKG